MMDQCWSDELIPCYGTNSFPTEMQEGVEGMHLWPRSRDCTESESEDVIAEENRCVTGLQERRDV